MWQQRRHKVILDIEAGQTGLSTRKLVLESFGYNVLAAATGGAAQSLMKQHPFDAVLLDSTTNDIPLKDLTAQIKACNHVPILLVGDHPYVPDDLREYVDDAMERLRDPKETLEVLDKLLGITDVPHPRGKALDDPKKLPKY
jgi:DNA-binding response OmpR family regulator